MKKQIEHYFDRLWPLCRSITGNGLRRSLNILQEIIPLQLTEVPTGTKVFDWEIPKEWNIRDAYILTPEGKRICSFQENNLHVLNYSVPVNKEVSFGELSKHLFTIPGQPDAIPYLTSYYHEQWGFCICYNEYKSLPKDGTYKVVIDSVLEPGSLTYGDFLLKGESDREIVFSTYLCHPSMANNELSGPLVAAFLYREIAALPDRKYTYRFIFAPETIGVIAYLSRHGMHLKKHMDAGFVLTCIGDAGPFTYKRSRTGNALPDRISEHVLKYKTRDAKIINFAIGGSDERQYCSPGFNLPVGSLMRTMYKEYKEYHTSLDNKSFISFDAMAESVAMYMEVVKALELNGIYVNTVPYCEPQLSKRNLYQTLGGEKREDIDQQKILHLLNYADGVNDLLCIAQKRDEYLLEYAASVKSLQAAELLVKKKSQPG